MHAEFIWLIIFTRNAWLQLVDGQVLSWSSWYQDCVFVSAFFHSTQFKIWKFCQSKNKLQLKAAWRNSHHMLKHTNPCTSLDVSTKFYINHNHAKNVGTAWYARLRFPSERLEEVLPVRHPVRDWAEQLGSQILFSSQWFFSLVNQTKLKQKLKL